jgi:hypothetical protein
MLFRILFFAFLGYIVIKSVRFLINIFTAVKSGKSEEKVYGTSKPKSKIDKKDVIDAQFEEIDVKNNKTEEN